MLLHWPPKGHSTQFIFPLAGPKMCFHLCQPCMAPLWLCQPDSKQLVFHSILLYLNWTSPLTLLHLFFQNHLFLILRSFLNWGVFFFRIYESSFSCLSSLGSVHLSSGLETSHLAVGMSCQFQGGSGCPSVCWCSLSATELCPGFLTCRMWSGLPGGLCAPPR